MDGYDAHSDRAEVADASGRTSRSSTSTIPRRASPRASTSSRCSRTRRHLHMGHVLNYTMGDVVTHFQRRHGYKVLRPMGFDSFGLPAENAAIKEGGHPLEITERNIAAITQPDAPHGLGDRLAARGLRARAELLPLDAVAVPEVPRARARLPQGGAGQLVPVRPDGARERARRRRPLLALREHRRGAEHGAVVLQDHRVRRPAARRPRRRSTGPTARRRSRRSWIGRSEGAELLFRVARARPRHPCLHDAPRHAVRRHVLRRRARVAARRAARRGHRARSGGPRLREASPLRGRPRSASSARRPASSPAATPSTRRPARRSRSGSPTTC